MWHLVSDMVQDDPAKRPTIDEVVTRFEAIRKKLGYMKLSWRVAKRKEWFGLVRDLMHFYKTVKRTRHGVPAVSSC
jgi:hypothetical protein